MKVAAVLLSVAVIAIAVGLVWTLRRPVSVPAVAPPTAAAPAGDEAPAAPPTPRPTVLAPPSGQPPAPVGFEVQQQVEAFLLTLETRAVIGQSTPADVEQGIAAIQQQASQLGPERTAAMLRDFHRHIEDGKAGRTGAKRLMRMMNQATGADRDAVIQAIRATPR